jgi:flagellar protein FlbD
MEGDRCGAWAGGARALEIGHRIGGPAEFREAHPEHVEGFAVIGPQVHRAGQRRRRLIQAPLRKQDTAGVEVGLRAAATFCHTAHSVAFAGAVGRGSSRRGGRHVPAMISLRRLNNQAIMVNADLIESLESTPDTVVTLTSGNKLLVRDSMEEIQSKIIEFKRQIYGPKEVQ